MRSIVNLFLVVFVAVAVISCKDNASKAADSTAEAATAQGVEYTITPETAKVTWEGSKPTGKHVGTVNVAKGIFTVKDGSLAAGTVVLDMNTITVTDLTGDDKAGLEEHLKGTGAEGADDFFSVTKFPMARFEIISVTPSTEAGVNSMVKGNLTIKDITKEVTIPANITINNEMVVVTSNPFTINRTDWGIKYASKNFFKEIGDKFIEDAISFQLMVEAKAAPATTPAQ